MQTLTDQDSYKTYMETIATSHVDLNWLKFGDEDVIRIGGQASMRGLGLWADEEKPVGFEGGDHDNFMAQHESSVVVMIAQKSKIVEQQTDYKNCEVIVREIIAKLITDYQNGEITTKINRAKFGQVLHTFGATKYTGCRLDLQWKESADLTLNESKWQ